MVSGDRLDCRLGRFFGLMMVVIIFYLIGIDDWLVMKLLGFNYDFELQQFLRETTISYDCLSSIALRSFTYGALALVSVTVIGFAYIAKKAFDTTWHHSAIR